MRLRMILSVALWGIALLGLAACTSSISGTPTFGGSTQATETSPAESSEETEETTEESSSEDIPPGEVDALLACLFVNNAYDSANTNFIALADATNAGTATTLTPDSVAADFDSAIISVQSQLDPLPPGPIRDAIQAAQTAAAGLRDGLRAASDVSNTDLNTALDNLRTACEF